MLRSQRGLTLIELVVSLAISTVITTGAVAILIQLNVLPIRAGAHLLVQAELRTASSWIRADSMQSQSFTPGTSPEYGTFQWTDLSLVPAEARQVTYSRQDGTLLRQENGQAAQALVHHVAQQSDVDFKVQETAHPGSPTATVRTLTATVTTTLNDPAAAQWWTRR